MFIFVHQNKNGMKPSLLLLLGFLSIIPVWGQDVISKMSDGTCECLKKRDISAKGADALQVELGLCLIEQVEVHKKGLKKAGYDTESAGIYEQLGQKVGVELALNCPEFMVVLGAMLKDKDSDFKDKVLDRVNNPEKSTPRPESVFLGEVKTIEYGDFVKIVLKDIDDKRKDFYWINSFQGDEALIAMESLENLVGQKLEIGYYEEEVYFHKMKAYLGINRITKLVIL